MIEFILGSIFGFAAGCTLKEFLKEKLVDSNNSKENQIPIRRMQPANKDHIPTDSSLNTNQHYKTRYNLSSINYLFDKYNIKLLGETSFSILLDNIERTTYRSTLQMFSSSVNSPKEMIDLLEHGYTINEIINPQYTNDGIYVSDSYVNKLLNEEEIDSLSISSIEEKIQLLISFHVSKGLKCFKRTLGPSLEQFISDYQENKDVSILYEEIKKNIDDDLSLYS